MYKLIFCRIIFQAKNWGLFNFIDKNLKKINVSIDRNKPPFIIVFINKNKINTRKRGSHE